MPSGSSSLPLKAIFGLAILALLSCGLHYSWIDVAGSLNASVLQSADATPSSSAFRGAAPIPSTQGLRPAASEALAESSDSSIIHICICSDDIDLRPAVAAIRSVVSSSAESHRLMFHYITSPTMAGAVQDIFALQLPGIPVEVHHNAALQAQISSRVTFRESSGSRQSLASAFNFAPFYLDAFLSGPEGLDPSIKRLIYMDGDVLVLGNMLELYQMDLKGKPCAAVQYCNQRLKEYVNFTLLEELGLSEGQNPEACIANRGVLVIDVTEWRAQRIASGIEFWLETYSTNDIWRGGMSQPPWLLALKSDNYEKLGDEWNCNGLGRNSMTPIEASSLWSGGFTDASFADLSVSVIDLGGDLKALEPYVAQCTASAKLLHYNGAMKPWLLAPDVAQQPICAMPEGLPQHLWKHQVSLLQHSPGLPAFVNCSEIWYKYYSHANVVLTDSELSHSFDQRKADEMKWVNKLKLDQEERERLRKEKEQEELRRMEEAKRLQEKKEAEELRRKKQREQKRSKDEDAKKASDLEKVKKRTHAQPLAGGFYKGQQVQSASHIVVKGVLMVPKKSFGIVMGPAASNPTTRIHVLWDVGKRVSINVVPQEILLVNQ
eukprot:TRINITY_DN96468_c0_g1_i1.p1 TRINITY_DN96468_c0_g1~~TRINITY_DN96468_c0_g1_i1.p1  ORF type:complete len:605 (+),score=92.23 TRINITY_DN96468_c0_g1_i1:68-1882(+)